MSRIGKQPVPIPAKVQLNLDGSEVTIKGPKGELYHKFPVDITIAEEDGQIIVTRPTDQRHHRALHGMTRALINNMVIGVSEGFEKVLSIEGVGYRPELEGNTLVLHLGFSHLVNVPAPEGITFEVDSRARLIKVQGIDKELVGRTAADIRKIRPPEPYKGKGIRYLGEYVRRKVGKAGKVG